jgi:hypothetical protein
MTTGKVKPYDFLAGQLASEIDLTILYKGTYGDDFVRGRLGELIPLTELREFINSQWPSVEKGYWVEFIVSFKTATEFARRRQEVYGKRGTGGDALLAYFSKLSWHDLNHAISNVMDVDIALVPLEIEGVILPEKDAKAYCIRFKPTKMEAKHVAPKVESAT